MSSIICHLEHAQVLACFLVIFPLSSFDYWGSVTLILLLFQLWFFQQGTVSEKVQWPHFVIARFVISPKTEAAPSLKLTFMSQRFLEALASKSAISLSIASFLSLTYDWLYLLVILFSLWHWKLSHHRSSIHWKWDKTRYQNIYFLVKNPSSLLTRLDNKQFWWHHYQECRISWYWKQSFQFIWIVEV